MGRLREERCPSMTMAGFITRSIRIIWSTRYRARRLIRRRRGRGPWITQSGTGNASRMSSRSSHTMFHFEDVAIQRNSFDRNFQGTNSHDLVAAIGAAIAVLKDKPAPAPFSIKDKKEALLLLDSLRGRPASAAARRCNLSWARRQGGRSGYRPRDRSGHRDLRRQFHPGSKPQPAP